MFIKHTIWDKDIEDFGFMDCEKAEFAQGID